MEELVDILVTTYNTNEKYLRKQIESILNQTYKNIKVYISDDCSSNEDVAQILKEYEKKDNRIKLFIQPKNLGYNKNFEFLLEQSTAEYIMFSDHDDVWKREKVEKSLAKLKQENVDLVYVNCRQIDEDGVVLEDDYFKYKHMPLINGKSNLVISRCVGIGCSQIITRHVKEKMIPFKKEVIAHDWLASFIANNGKGISYIKEPLFDYRLHSQNVFGGRNLKQNLKKWKIENGKGYKSYLKYREEKVIKKGYLDGIEMCRKYTNKKESQEYINGLEKYYDKLIKSKYINLNLAGFFKYLTGKNLFKQEIKEIMIFHFPILAYIEFALVKTK